MLIVFDKYEKLLKGVKKNKKMGRPNRKINHLLLMCKRITKKQKIIVMISFLVVCLL